MFLNEPRSEFKTCKAWSFNFLCTEGGQGIGCQISAIKRFYLHLKLLILANSRSHTEDCRRRTDVPGQIGPDCRDGQVSKCPPLPPAPDLIQCPLSARSCAGACNSIKCKAGAVHLEKTGMILFCIFSFFFVKDLTSFLTHVDNSGRISSI